MTREEEYALVQRIQSGDSDAFAVLMGYYYSLVHFGHHPRRNAVWVLFAPILAHGIFDTIAMSQEVSQGMEGLLAVALLLFCNELRKLCKRHISNLQAADDHYNRNPFQVALFCQCPLLAKVEGIFLEFILNFSYNLTSLII